MAQARTNHITVMVKLAHSSEAAAATRNPPAAISHNVRWVTPNSRPRSTASHSGRFALPERSCGRPERSFLDELSTLYVLPGRAAGAPLPCRTGKVTFTERLVGQ